MRLVVLFIVLPALAVVALLLIAVWVDRERLGLEHTIYLYHRLIDPPAAQRVPSPATYRLEMWRAEQALKGQR